MKTSYPERSRQLTWILPPALILIMLLATFDQLLFADRVAFASDASVNEAPQSVMQTEQEFDETNANRGSIDKVEFLNVDGLDAQTIENVMANAEFQAQVEDLRRSGSPLPAMSVLVALFVMGSLSLGGSAGSGRSYVNVPLGRKLSDFFRVDKVPRVVTKMVDVVKKVPVYTTRVVKETLSRVVKVPRQVAYTAYKTVREVTHRTKEIVSNVVRYRPQSRIDRLSNMLRFIDRYTPETGHRVQRGIYSQLRYLRREFEELRRMSGRTLRGRELHYYNRSLWQVQQAMASMAEGIVNHTGHGSPEYQRLRSIYLKDVEGRYVDRVVNYVKEPVVNFVQKAYTAFRTEYDVKTETYVEERTVTDVSYKDVVEQKEVKETVYDNKITPLSEKIGLALNYVRNLKRIKAKPSNRSFFDALHGFDRGSAFAGLSQEFRNIGLELDRAMRDPSAETVEWKTVPVQNYNAFVKKMKVQALNIRKSDDAMAEMFGKQYIEEIVEAEKGLQSYAVQEKNAITKKIELLEMYATGQISKDYYRTQYDNCKEKARQARTNAAKLRDKIADRKAWYTRKFHDTLDQIDRLAYLKDTKTWKEILTKTNITFGIKHLSPELAVNGGPVFAGGTTLKKAGVLDTLKRIITAKVTDLTATVLTTGDGLRLRTEPKTSGGSRTVIQNLRAGDQLKIVGKQNGWFKVQLSNGTTGWISGDPEYVKVSAGAPVVAQSKAKKTIKTSAVPYNPLPKDLKLHSSDLENAILHKTINPVRETELLKVKYNNGTSWSHVKKDSHAIDLNLGGGNGDLGQPVFASYDGVVKHINVDGLGYVLIEHNADLVINKKKQNTTWWTGYMHMNDIIPHGTIVKAGQQIGTIGKVSPGGAKYEGMTAHLHYAVYTGESMDKIQSIDLSKWAEGYSIPNKI